MNYDKCMPSPPQNPPSVDQELEQELAKRRTMAVEECARLRRLLTQWERVAEATGQALDVLIGDDTSTQEAPY